MGYAVDVAWRHSEALGFPRSWYREKGVAWLVRAIEARVLAPIADGESITVTTRLTGYRKVTSIGRRSMGPGRSPPSASTTRRTRPKPRWSGSRRASASSTP